MVYKLNIFFYKYVYRSRFTYTCSPASTSQAKNRFVIKLKKIYCLSIIDKSKVQPPVPADQKCWKKYTSRGKKVNKRDRKAITNYEENR